MNADKKVIINIGTMSTFIEIALDEPCVIDLTV
jgi:hypothetical protein